MEVHQIQCKFPKISYGSYASTIVSQREKMDDDEEEGENRRANLNNGCGSINLGGAQQEAAAVKSTVGSSSSENSKGSRPSNSRSENRFRAREKAKQRENEKSSYVASFTEILSGGGINYTNGGGGGGKEASVYRDRRPITDGNSNHQSNIFLRFPMDYFSSGLPGPPATASPAEIATLLLLSAATDHHPELQPFSFTSDHLASAINSSAINRGTLQSNSSSSPSLYLPPNFFGGGTAPAGNHNQFFPGFDARLHLYYGDGEGNDGNDGEHSGPKRKDKP